jgi:hypothetical protein
MDAPYPSPYSERSLLLLGYDMRKPHNYLVIDDSLLGQDSHLLDRYNQNRTTLCDQAVQTFDVAPQGAAFCSACYNVLLQRTGVAF